MKSVDIHQITLDACVAQAQSERIVITRDGNPIAVVLGIDGMDTEQIELGSSDKFWQLIDQRRKQATLTRTELQSRFKDDSSGG